VGAKYILGEKDLCFYHKFKTFFSEHNKILEAQKWFGGNCPQIPPCLGALAEPWPESLPLGAFMFVEGRLDILKILLDSKHEQHLQIVQINDKYFPANTYNRLVVSN